METLVFSRSCQNFCDHSETEPDRIERLNRVYGYAIGKQQMRTAITDYVLQKLASAIRKRDAGGDLAFRPARLEPRHFAK